MANLLLRLLLLGCLLGGGCSPLQPLQEASYHPQETALRLLSPTEVPHFADDFDRPSLIAAATRQLAYLHRQDPHRVIDFGIHSFRMQDLIISIQNLLDKLQENPPEEELQNFLTDNYRVFQAAGRDGGPFGEMLVTGYYEPVFAGSLSPNPTYSYPLYMPPLELVAVDRSANGRTMARRDTHGDLVPFWSRGEIDDNPSLLRGYELVYLADPFEVFLLHLQGSGRIQLPDHTIRSVRFAASNGLDYKSIGKLLVDEDKLSLEEATIPGIRGYLKRNPHEQRPVFNHNPRYIFFRWGDDDGPRGSSGEILTPGRSVAVDKDILPVATFGLVVTSLPINENDPGAQPHPLSRIIFPQDTGAAIKGPGRIDIFFGSGKGAEEIAYRLKEPGELYFFVWKHLREHP
jgi:membrane-bound lytic murein transglycosylase A